MRFLEIEPAYRDFIGDLLVRFGFDPAGFPLDMAPADEMFFKGVLPGYPERPSAAVFRYVESALRTHEVWRQLADHLGGPEALDRALDFGSGYGRLTRPLSRRLPADRLWVSDIYADAVAWQVKTFGVNGVVSAPDPDGFALDNDFPLVFAASVFSHLPADLFRRWLGRLYGLVRPGGLLAFSVHGPALAPEGQTIGPDGLGYAHWSESDSLDPAIYGMSYVTEDFVRRAAAAACGADAAETLRLFPCALFENQDLYVLGGPGANLRDLEVFASPVGAFKRFGRPGIPWTGWGLEPNPGRRLVRAELFVDDQRVATVRPEGEEADVKRHFPGCPNMPLGWAFDPLSGGERRLVRVEMTSDTGRKAYAYGMTGLGEGPAAPRT